MLVLFASPHENGKTKKLLNSFIESLKNQVEINFFNTYERPIIPCNDCGKCIKTGQCKFDDLNTLKANLENCDVIVIASPIYNLGFPSPLKSVLDRFQSYYNFHLQNGYGKLEKKKEVILLLTCGSKCDNLTVDMLERQTNCILKYLNAKVSSKIIWDRTDVNSELNKNVVQKIREVSDLLNNLNQ